MSQKVSPEKSKGFFLGELNWNPSFQFASLSSDLANHLQK